MRNRIAEVLNALPPREPIAVFVVNQKLRVMTDFTEDPAQIARALADAWGEQGQPPPSCDGDYRDRVPCAQFLALDEIAQRLERRSGRKNLFWISSGFAVANLAESNPVLYNLMNKTVEDLNQADIAVDPIVAEGVAAPKAYSAERRMAPPVVPGRNPSRGPIGQAGAFWSDKTGGFAGMYGTDAGTALARALDNSEITYSLGFYPESLDGRFHQLRVRVDRSGADVWHRKGYSASPPPDLVTGNIAGQTLETQAANATTRTLEATMQLPYFYTATNRARVRLSLDVIPAGMKFVRQQGRLHGQIEFVGTAMRDGEAAARFADTVAIDMEDQAHADGFTRATYHYEHQFLLAAGTYGFQMVIGTGGDGVGQVQAALTIEPWNSGQFGIGGIAFSTETRPAPVDTDKLFVAAGREFLPAATNRFRTSDRVYFYTQIYDPATSTLAAEYRILNRATGAVEHDSGMASIANYARPGNPVVPFATMLPVSKLTPGSWRLEVRAATVVRTIDFEVTN